MNDMGDRIKSNRVSQNMTQKELADKLNVTQKTISKWETGVGYPDVSMYVSISEVLKVDIDYLFKGIDMDTDIGATDNDKAVLLDSVFKSPASEKVTFEILNWLLFFSINYTVGTMINVLGFYLGDDMPMGYFIFLLVIVFIVYIIWLISYFLLGKHFKYKLDSYDKNKARSIIIALLCTTTGLFGGTFMISMLYL